MTVTNDKIKLPVGREREYVFIKKYKARTKITKCLLVE